MPKIARIVLFSALIAAPAARADDDPSTIVSELSVTAKPRPTPTPLPGVDVVVPRKAKPTALEGVDVAPPKTCLAARNPPDKAVPAPKLVSTIRPRARWCGRACWWCG